MKKTNKNRKNTKKSIVYQIFTELINALGNKYSAEFLYDRATKIVELHLPNTNFKDGYGRPNTHSSGYFSKDVLCMLENQPWLPVYNERINDLDCSYNHNQFLKELGVR